MSHRHRFIIGISLLFAVSAPISIWVARAMDTRRNMIRVENPTFVSDGLSLGVPIEVVFRVRNEGEEALEVVGCVGT